MLLYLKDRQEKAKADRLARAKSKLVECDEALAEMIPLLADWVKKMNALSKLAEKFERIQV